MLSTKKQKKRLTEYFSWIKSLEQNAFKYFEAAFLVQNVLVVLVYVHSVCQAENVFPSIQQYRVINKPTH